MLNPYVSCTIWAFESLITYVFFSRIARRRGSVAGSLLIGLLIFELGSGANLLFHSNVVINTTVSTLIRIGLAVACFEIRLFPAALYSFILGVIDFALEVIVVFGLSAWLHTDTRAFDDSLPLLIVEVTTCKSLFFLTSLTLSNFVQPAAPGIKLPMNMFLFPLTASVSVLIFWYVSTLEGVTPQIQTLLAFASMLLFGSIVLLFITYQHQIEAESEHIRIKSEFDRLQTEKSYYDILEQQNEQLMIYAHDAKNHLSAIKALNENPAIDGYLDQMSDRLRSYSRNCRSGNMMLDVMLNKYSLDSRRRGVAFDYDVKGCNLREMEDMDLVAVLGNLMDNALRSAESSAGRTITLETTRRNGYSIIIIQNSCDQAPSESAGRLLTTKADRKLHGYGLKSVETALKKYNGDFSWEYDRNRKQFTTTVMVGPAN